MGADRRAVATLSFFPLGFGSTVSRGSLWFLAVSVVVLSITCSWAAADWPFHPAVQPSLATPADGALTVASGGSQAATAMPPSLQIGLQLVASGLVSPLSVTHSGDGTGRLFVVDQIGRIRVIENGVLLPVPFLDLTAKIVAVNAFFDERGLLGLAFHPNYRNNGRFFVRYSAPRTGVPSESCNDPLGFIVGCHEEILAEYHVQGNPLVSIVADPNSEIILFRVDEPEFNHDGGDVAFGPDGYLYFSLGDGGGANDGLDNPNLPHGPIGNGQNMNVPLGKMLRIDVNSGSPYSVPPSNPFVGGPGLDEIYASGFRNPYRFSFDVGPGGSNALFVGDVGQDLFEEVDIVIRGGNYGWVIREGFHCFDAFNTVNPPAVCPATGAMGEPLLDPVNEYSHAAGGLAVVGGFVYRGIQSLPLNGKYVYGDFSADFGPTGRLYYFDTQGPNAYQRQEFFILPNGDPFGHSLKGFGRDEDGEIYVCASINLGPTGNTGVVYRLVGPPPAGTVPTVSAWGLIAFTLLLLSAAKFYFSAKRRTSGA